MTSTVIGLYDDMQSAQQVVRELRDYGLSNDRISLVANDASGEYGGQLGGGTTTKGRKGKKDDSGGAEKGAGIGAVLGGLGGLLVGLGALTIPGIGPVIAAGPLATAISGLVGAGVGAVAGAATGGLLGALVDMGIPEEQAQYYTEGVRRGGTLVVVESEDQQVDEVREIMDRHNPVDIDERASQWRSSGWQYEADAQPYTHDQITQDRQQYRTVNTGEEVRMPVVEEELRVGKRQVERGGVRVHTRVTEQPVQEDVHLRQERVSVERRPVDRPIGSGDMEAFQEGTVEVTEMGEEAVVEKRARVAEEVVVRKDVEERDETIRDTVRRSDVEVEQTGGQMRGGTMSGDMSGMTDRSGIYRGHYQTNFANSGYQYEHYEPAYMYGSQLHDYEGYQGWEWDRVEPEARQAWEQRNPGTWDRIRDAVRYGFDNMRENVRGEGTSARNRNRG